MNDNTYLVKYQVLIYPVLQNECHYCSYKTWSSTPLHRSLVFFFKEDNYGKVQFLFFDVSDLIYLTLRLSDESLFSTTAAILSFQPYNLRVNDCLNVESILSEQTVHNLLYRSVCQSCPLRSCSLLISVLESLAK